MRLYIGFLVSVCWIVFIALPSQAQWNRLGQKIQINAIDLYHMFRSPIHHSVTRQVSRAAIPPQVKSAMFTVKDKNFFMRTVGVCASAFAIEEEYEGKHYVWGISASHYGFEQPVYLTSFLKYTPLPVQVRGNSRANDVLLFSLPKEIAHQVKPLPLAQQDAQPQEVLSSAGFFDQDWQYEPNRVVRESTPLRTVTTLTVDPEICREGACGGPVLNQQGEVVGLHVGSSCSKQEGYVVPVTQIRQALQALHQGHATTPLLFQGVPLHQLAIDESISRLDFYYQQKRVAAFSTRYNIKEVDYAHLEKFLPSQPVDELVVIIYRQPFPRTRKPYYYEIHYPLNTSSAPKTPDF